VGVLKPLGMRRVWGRGVRGLTRELCSLFPGHDGVIGVQGDQIPMFACALGLGDRLRVGEVVGGMKGVERRWPRAR
jgi:hypothetical protein